MPLTVEQLEDRNVPAFIPGWNGPETVLYHDLNNDSAAERIAIAGIGGSARVVIEDGATAKQAANFIVFEEDFRGGGFATVAGDSLVIVPGPGGGPRIVVYRMSEGIVASYAAPSLPENYRGGMQVAAGPAQNVFILTDDDLLSMDPLTGSVFDAVNIGSGWRFEPTGGWVEEAGLVEVMLERGTVKDHRVAETLRVEMS